MKKTAFYLILLIGFFVACNNAKDTKAFYTPEFYEPLPFDGMKGNVEQVIEKRWTASIVEQDTVYRGKLFYERFANYAADGQQDSIAFHAFGTMDGNKMSILTKNIFENNKIKYMNQYTDNGSGKEYARITFNRESNEKLEAYAKGTIMGIEVDTLYQTMKYGTKDKSTTLLPALAFQESQVMVTYYENNLPQKQMMEKLNAINTFTYDDNNQLISILSEAINVPEHIDSPSILLRQDFIYLKWDEKGNWIERSIKGDGGLLQFEEREITYRQ